MAFEVEYGFDELKINICDRTENGILFYGYATLVDAGPGYEGEFYVSEIRLDSGSRLYREGTVEPFESELFKRLSLVIEADNDASAFFAGKLDGNSPEVPMFKRRAGLSRIMAYVDAGPPVRIPEMKYTGSISPQAAE